MVKEKPKVLRKPEKDDPEDALYRIYSVMSYVVVLIVIGLPVWWLTTRVYRADLPLTRMQELELGEPIDKPYGIPLSLDYEVLITIVNPNPRDLKVDLDGELLDINLRSFLNLSVSDFIVKSQWLYLTELGVVPKNEEGIFYLTEEQLPHVITPLEKKLWSHMSLSPCINLVVYVSDCRTPLYIRDRFDNLVAGNSFLSSSWGGITILNPDSNSCQSSVYKPDLSNIVSIFRKQLRRLLQLNGKTEADNLEFKQMRIREMIESTKRTLKSLAQLLSEISSIVISDDVAEKINVALENSELAESFLKEGNVELALKTSKLAFKNSEAAFSDPSLLALLYFPDDQKYAIYIPLFLPVMIPVLMSITTIRRWYVNFKDVKDKVE